MTASRRGTPAASLYLIRLAIMMGPVILGIVTWFLLRGGSLQPDPSKAASLGLVVMLVSIGMALGLIVARTVRDRAPDRAARVTATILAWAMGEAAALIGVVHWMVTGLPNRLWPGALLMILAFLLFPVPPDGSR